ncbi:hypothetical protein BD410DRAFT_728304 [Rickenella mellea]|uniref:RlpA-like protein double-psi beta-barrel domain-containing protein n=1 Tax=Rickenella mellea TaxID=50990 RepID=A0A4Y7PT43_9AGAM|nr:hypothetical protein BD410DRAFT_728304 [Rickenella mellea]
MKLSHTSLFAVTFLASVVCALAVPVATAAQNGTIDKRVDHTGRATFFNTEGVVGVCGHKDQDSDHIVAVSPQHFGNGGNCEQWVRITANGQSHFGQTRDVCPGCGIDSLDLSTSLFEEFMPLDVGFFEMTWHFMPKGFTP